MNASVTNRARVESVDVVRGVIMIIMALDHARDFFGLRSERSMNQESVNESEWNNPANWWGGLLYHSRLDDRIWVPKMSPAFGTTINLGRRIGLAIAIAIPALIVALIITAALGY